MPEYRKEIRLARAAWMAALADKWDAATRYVVRLDAECGGEGLGVALMAWCDTYLDHAMDGAKPYALPRLGFVRADTGALDRHGSSAVPEKVQWAGRLLAARAANDQAAWVDLIEELPDDGQQIAEHIMAVLHVTALSYNGFPRGFALMGRGEVPDASRS